MLLGQPLTSEDVARIEAAAVGELVSVRGPKGDGCNTCEFYYRKVATEVQFTGQMLCTLIACPATYPAERYK
jgi:hypothetical protein